MTTVNRTPDLLFRETMRGHFAIGASEPLAGAAARDGDAGPMELRATLSIDDLPAFLRDPDHLGRLEGRITHHALGSTLPLRQGAFSLFAPAADGRIRLMVYQGVFEAGGRPFFFIGQKILRRRRLLAVWPETTTLFSRLHRGETADGEIVGAGVLGLGPVALLRMLATFRSPASGLPGAVATVGRFGAFFGAELWRIYVGGTGGALAPGSDSTGREP